MTNRKKWIIGCTTLLVLTSLIVTYASMTTSGESNAGTSESTNKILFDDVQKSDWFYDDVQYVKEKALMTGTDEQSFSPNKVTTRGMIVTVLWRNEGSPKADFDGFDDVKSDKYYYQAVSWAFDNEIVSGYDSKTFGAEDDITREQLATIMFRYANFKNYGTTNKEDLSKFSDSNMVSDYAVSAFEWALANKIITGTSETTLEPKGNALRSQVAAILRRFDNTYSTKTESESENTVHEVNISSAKSGGTSSSKNDTTGNNGGTVNANTSITISEAKASKGDDVKIVAKISNNPGILGMTLTVEYDEHNLTLAKAENGVVFKNKLDFTTSKNLVSGANFVWDGTEISESDIQDGEFLIMSFHIPESAQSGKYPISLSFKAGDIVNNNLSVVELTTNPGYITIE